MDSVAQLPEKDRAELFQETAAKLDLRPGVVEKDFWVCWTLSRLFSGQRDGPKMLFKGGTSLSKAYNAIKRFSEDIDLSLDRHDLGFVGSRDPLYATGSNEIRRLRESLDSTYKAFVRDKLFPQLLDEFASILGSSKWSIRIEEENQQMLIILEYPSQIPKEDYLRQTVVMEFGATSDHDMTENMPITPFAAEQFPAMFSKPSSTVRVYDPSRTFWEKATILHYNYHVNDATKVDRTSRHYYDVVLLDRGSIGQAALQDPSLLLAVAKYKRIFFPKTSAKYEEAKVGTLRLVPQQDLIAPLRADYGKMQLMLYDKPPTFDEIIDALKTTEENFNAVNENG